jgi:acyl-CoA reductase-like NAD-dependent aldehyde dehydrogenase
MSTALELPHPTDRAALDAALTRLRDAAAGWARAPLAARLALARSMLDGAIRIADRSVAAAAAAKGFTPGTPAEGEEWLGSPFVTIRLLRQLVRSLAALDREGDTGPVPLVEAEDGRLVAQVLPASRQDALVLPGIRGEVHLERGVDARTFREARARFHRAPDHQGAVCLVLGAGNVNAIPPTDVATKLFNEGKVCLLKMNPVNAYMGPLLEEAFSEAIAAGYLAIVHGGAEEGAYLAHHPFVDEVHVTGSDRTHDAIVWGPPGPERAERMARGQPLLAKEITSELGNVTPVLVVPGPWSARELAYQADDVAGMVTHNASFNCVAGKMLVLPRGWRLRDRFLELVADRMARSPARRAWYPGAADRYRALTAGRAEVRRHGEGGEGTLPWTLLPGLEAEDASEIAFRTEPFCAILSETQVGSEDPLEFLEAAVRFANERLWGTLSAAILACGAAQRDPAVAAALERAIGGLRYGTVCVNVWPGMGFAAGTLPWGAYPGSPLTDVQSGRGFVHNTLMLERVEKSVIRGPAWSPIKLPYFPSHRSAHVLGRRLTALEEKGAWTRLPGVFASALRG